MQISNNGSYPLSNEIEVINAELPLDGATVLELGCGRAEKTRALAQQDKVAAIVALEVDTRQHAKNLEAPLAKVTFSHGGAEAIPAADTSFDIVMMFKSLHHVPMPLMAQAMREINRVLKPGGIAWISEPVYAGEFNEIIRLFHDEKIVRQAAFDAVRQAVDDGLFALMKQRFFATRGHFDSFEQFDQRMIQVTHTDHQLSPALYEQVRQKFETHLTPDGAVFSNPLRVDVLRKI